MKALIAESKDDFLHQLGLSASETEGKDFRIVVGGREYEVHKLVLRLHSKFFDRLFKSDFKVSDP